MNNFKQLESDLKELLTAPKKTKRMSQSITSKSYKKISMNDTIKKLPNIKKKKYIEKSDTKRVKPFIRSFSCLE